VISVYNNNTANLKDFVGHLNNFAAKLLNPSRTVILGDLNCCALLQREFQPLANFCHDFGFEQLIQETTHKDRAIDHIYIGADLKSLSFGLLAPLEKHHAIPWVSVDAGKPSKTAPKFIELYNFKRAKWAYLSELLFSANLPKIVVDAASVEDAWNSWSSKVKRVYCQGDPPDASQTGQ